MTETSEEIRISALPEKCTKLPVLIVMLKQRYLLNLTQKDLFTAGIVFLTTGHPEKTADTKPEFASGARGPFLFVQADLYITFLNIP
jgi:hypothetical protein